MTNCTVPKCDNKAVSRGLCGGHKQRMKNMGNLRADVPLGMIRRGNKPGDKSLATPAQAKPSTQDIVLAAGWFEGEGHAANAQVGVTQKRLWVLHKLVRFFGGHIYKFNTNYQYKQNRKNVICYRWQISGARARGFGMTIYKFLSPYRQAQIRKVLKFTTARPGTVH